MKSPKIQSKHTQHMKREEKTMSTYIKLRPGGLLFAMLVVDKAVGLGW